MSCPVFPMQSKLQILKKFMSNERFTFKPELVAGRVDLRVGSGPETRTRGYH